MYINMIISYVFHSAFICHSKAICVSSIGMYGEKNHIVQAVERYEVTDLIICQWK